ncbi:hypothetical protein [Riemerella columbina]|uniref:hypothetical protein n=1 Tax=Riemerella columbina TaxID=103810 RepID=UPI00039D9E94|nr:hypothetical protein [Riemerella columbina]
MKNWLVGIFLMLGCMVNAQNLRELRGSLLEAKESEKVALRLIATAKKGFEKSKVETYRGYEAVGYFFMANHVFNPIKKLQYFKKGRNLLKAAIEAAPNDLELRVLRLKSQEEMPSILGYSSDINADRVFLKKKGRCSERC